MAGSLKLKATIKQVSKLSICVFTVLLLLTGNLMLTSLAEETSIDDLNVCVKLYREGHYAKALKQLESLHKADPSNLHATYYLAITHAQMGHYTHARQLYQDLTLLDPQGAVGRYAKEGLQYLPTSSNSIDPPPRIQNTANGSPPPTQNTPQQAFQNPQPQANPAEAMAQANGMSLQEWQSLQMMLGNGNGMNNNGMNMGMNMGSMMPMMMGQGQGMDPNVMSTLMMNQMMQNMDLGGGNNNNNN